MISLLEHTFDSYTSQIAEKLGKGKVLSGLLYRHWMKKGKLFLDDPAFTNAESLIRSILDASDFSFPALATMRMEEETCKFLLRMQDGYEVESVRIPMKSGNTLCVSSQVGCQMGCRFCETGRMGLLRNLKAKEIVAQVHVARFGLLGSIDNIVFMGMGEPFDNYDEVMRAIEIVTDQNGLAFGNQNITVSTSGKIEGILRLAEEKTVKPNLAVSVNAPFDALRSKLMPHNRKESMQALYDAMKTYSLKTNREVLVAYVLMQGINDSQECAEGLIRYLDGLDVKVNLIPYNSQGVSRYQAPDCEVVDAFASTLRSANLRVLLRKTKGRSIMAACGQLSTRK